MTLYAPKDGKKEFSGILTDFNGDTFTLDGEMEIARKDAAQVRLHIDF